MRNQHQIKQNYKEFERIETVEIDKGLQLLTVGDVARQLNLPRSSVYRLVKGGYLRPVKIGKLMRFTQEEIERFCWEGTGHG